MQQKKEVRGAGLFWSKEVQNFYGKLESHKQSAAL